MDAKIAAAVPLSSPAAAQRCAAGAGLDSGAADAAQSAMPSIALLPLHRPQPPFPPTPLCPGAPPPVPNLHQLDGRNRQPGRSDDENEDIAPFLSIEPSDRSRNLLAGAARD